MGKGRLKSPSVCSGPAVARFGRPAPLAAAREQVSRRPPFSFPLTGRDRRHSAVDAVHFSVAPVRRRCVRRLHKTFQRPGQRPRDCASPSSRGEGVQQVSSLIVIAVEAGACEDCCFSGHLHECADRTDSAAHHAARADGVTLTLPDHDTDVCSNAAPWAPPSLVPQRSPAPPPPPPSRRPLPAGGTMQQGRRCLGGRCRCAT